MRFPIRCPTDSRPTERSALKLPLVALAAACLLLFVVVGASANPSIQDKRAQAQAIFDQVQTLDEEVGAAAERWNGANYRLGQIERDLQQTRADLKRARVQVKVSQKRIGARLRELYMGAAPASAVEIVLGASSLQEALDMLDANDRIAEQDTRIARDFRRYRATVASHERRLTKARSEQREIVRERAAEKAAIEANLAERKQLLASVQEEVRRLEAEEQRRQAEEKRRALAELARQQAAAAAQARSAEEAAQAAVEPALPAFSATPETTDIPAASAGDAGKGMQAVSIAMQYLGVPYVWGGASPSGGFDCSGLTMYVYAQVGISLPHYAAAQYGMGVPVSKDALQPGDLVFFNGLGHMGMYIGGGQFIHAPHTGDAVKISSLSESYYTANWVGARRVV